MSPNTQQAAGLAFGRSVGRLTSCGPGLNYLMGLLLPQGGATKAAAEHQNGKGSWSMSECIHRSGEATQYV